MCARVTTVFSRLLTPSHAFSRLLTPSHAFPRLLTPSHAVSRGCTGLYVKQAQVAAQTLGCAMGLVSVEDVTSRVSTGSTGGSTTSEGNAASVRLAGLNLKLRLASGCCLLLLAAASLLPRAAQSCCELPGCCLVAAACC